MKIGNITFDCADPDALATFWAAAMHYRKGVYPEQMRRELLDAGLTDDDLAARAIAEDAQGRAPGCSSSACRRARPRRTACTWTSTPRPAAVPRPTR